MSSVPGAPSIARFIHVGRQPIYDLARDVVGYELLFHSPTSTVADHDGDSASGQVIVNAFTEFGVPELVGGRLCFINLTRAFLVGDLALPFGPEHVVLEVLETVDVDDQVVAGVTELAAQGYRIALDDFVWGSGHEKLLEIASYVKLDLLDTDPEVLADIARTCRGFPDLRLVGERVETPEHLALATELGCDLLQGFLLGRPQVMSRQVLSPSRLARIELMTALLGEDVDMAEIVAMVTRDPALSFRLLRATNCAATGVRRPVSSVHEAVVMIGTEQVRRWVSLMALNDLVDADELQLTRVVVQARMCHLIAEALGEPGAPAFTAGLLTGVASLLGESVHGVVERLPLAPDLAEAVVVGTGPLGRIVAAVRAYDDPVRAGVGLPAYFTHEWLAHAYLAATSWATRTLDTALGRADSPS